jgi:ATP-dependent DNA helicase RecG
MLPKASSGTTSSKSNTAPDFTPIQFVKGVGPRLGVVFENRGIRTVRDVLYFFPRAYEDRTKLSTVADLQADQIATIPLKVISVKRVPLRTGRSMLDVRAGDETGTISLKWFHVPRGMDQRFQPGKEIIATGTVKRYMGRVEIAHPEITWSTSVVAADKSAPGAGAAHVGRTVPIYVEIEGVSSRILRNVLFEALNKYTGELTEDLPARLLEKYALPRLGTALKQIHFPSDAAEVEKLVEFDTPAHWRLIYEEFFKFEYLVLRQRLRMEKALAVLCGMNGGQEASRALEKILPFKLTGGQSQAVAEILRDIAQSHPMNRLIQGDVGSGKTAVAFLTAGCVLAEGGQAALMAPTEILAEQHYRNAVKTFGGRLNVALLTGKTTAAERAHLLARLAAGEPILLIGTHALIEDPVVFKNLVYVMIDEQHRFGVEQRRALRKKGSGKDEKTGRVSLPHTLILTATPIPRTLALTAYGDLAVSSIHELPPGRSPIKTKVAREKNERTNAIEVIRKELQAGHQAYFIYPLVNDSEAEGFTSMKSAVAEAERLSTEVFPEFKVGLLHGQMSSDEKSTVMERFKRGELNVLVSTTVVEVGVDVPNATIMVVEHAERFGLSQLHQLRGRVGRGSAQSFCFLFSKPYTAEATSQRLDVLEQTQDGFKIAEADLEIRGPGEFLGTRQAGGLPFRLAHLVRDREWLLRARDDVMEILREDPNLEAAEHAALRRYFEREGKAQFERLKTG